LNRSTLDLTRRPFPVTETDKGNDQRVGPNSSVTTARHVEDWVKGATWGSLGHAHAAQRRREDRRVLPGWPTPGRAARCRQTQAVEVSAAVLFAGAGQRTRSRTAPAG
jgi:hypothetical protein